MNSKRDQCGSARDVIKMLMEARQLISTDRSKTAHSVVCLQRDIAEAKERDPAPACPAGQYRPSAVSTATCSMVTTGECSARCLASVCTSQRRRQ